MSREPKRRRSGLHLGRYAEIISVLVKYGFGDVLASFHIDKYVLLPRRLTTGKAGGPPEKRTSRWERIRSAVEELGPTFIKLGQFLSNRPDMLPDELVVELEKLQDSVKPFPGAEAREILEQELKKPISTIFAEFNETPTASASIAQVHRARLQDGSDLAIKIQRPHIRQTIANDLAILADLAALFERHDERARALHLSQFVSEFQRVLEKELDFRLEASHIGAFRKNFKDDLEVYIPRVFAELTTRKILATEFVEGIKASEVHLLDEAKLDRRIIARRGARLILRQIFEHGFFHADPHPGNILIRADGTVCLLDFGAVGTIPASLRSQMGVILYGVVNKDAGRIVRTLSRLSPTPIKNTQQLEYDITELIQEYGSLPLSEIDMSSVLQRFSRIITEHDLRILPGFYVLVRALITVESVGTQIDPSFNILEEAAPFVKKLLRGHPDIRSLPTDLYFTLADIISLLRDLPFELKDIMRVVKAGELHILFEHRGLEGVVAKLDQFVNKLVFAIVLAALIVGSSVVVHSGIPPKVFDIPVVGLAGYVLAGLIGFGLLFSIVRNRRM
jgi:ubiquinone biosynthesis protein